MSFKLDLVEFKSIVSPVLLKIEGEERRFENGTALANLEFDRKYEITSIKAKDNLIEVTATEKSLLPTEDWTDKEISFF